MNSVFFYFIALSNRPSGRQLNRLTSDRVTERYPLMFFSGKCSPHIRPAYIKGSIHISRISLTESRAVCH